MNKYGGKVRLGVITLLGVAALAMVGLHRSSGRAYSADSTPTLFVTDNCSGAVTAYPAASTGDVSPLAAATGLSEPESVAVDENGNIYAANACNRTVTIYAKGSNGNAAPIATIGGSNTDLVLPTGIAVDSSGYIYVVDQFYPAVFVYLPLGSSTGLLNESPTAVIYGSNTDLFYPVGITLDSSGKIYVTDQGDGEDDIPPSVFVYPALSVAGMLNEAPTATISGSNTDLEVPFGIALDSSGKIYVTDEGAASVFVYPALGSSTGVLNEAPTATIGGSDTGLNSPLGIVLDSSGKIYVADWGSLEGELVPSVIVYPALGSSTGLLNEAPTASITGSNTDLELPIGIAHTSGKIYVADEGAASVFVYPTLGSSTGLLNEAPSSGTISTILTTGFLESVALDSSGKIYAAGYEPNGDPGVLVYAAGSNGNAAPIATISGASTGLKYPHGIALDSSGKIYVADYGATSVFVYPALGSSTGVLDEAPLATINGSKTDLKDPAGIALDSSGKIYVADYGATSVFVYKALGSSTGVLDEGPTASISGSKTDLKDPYGIALDSSRKIYVTDQGAEAKGPGSVFVYAALGSSTGLLDNAPVATISGSKTDLDVPFGIALDSSDNIYVADDLPSPEFLPQLSG
ncbi:hypothetical protein, partial [Candidatus Binatus sp.]